MVLVTGATGWVGQAVVRTLRQLNLDVRAMVRKGSEYYWLNDTGCRFFFADFRDHQSLKRAVEGCDQAIICSRVAWETRHNNHQTSVAGHRFLFEQMDNRQVVLLSCLQAEPTSAIPGMRATAAVERELEKLVPQHVIVRSGPTERLFLDVAEARLPWSRDTAIPAIPRRDLALSLIRCLDAPDVQRQTVRLGPSSLVRPDDALHLTRETLGPPRQLARLLGQVPLRRLQGWLDMQRGWFESPVPTTDVAPADWGISETDFLSQLQQAADWRALMRDPDERRRRVVHPQFYANVYDPGETAVSELPKGPGQP